MKTLLEDYKRKLEILKNTTGLDAVAKTRIKTKQGCYRAFVSELEREIKEQEASDAQMRQERFDKAGELYFNIENPLTVYEVLQIAAGLTKN